MTNIKRFALASLAVATLGLTACGGGGGDGTPTGSNGSNNPGNSGNNTVSLTGVFIDSAVAGLRYVTKNSAGTITHTGSTNVSGEYTYDTGDQVTFSIGDITFPPVTAKSTVTPLDVAGTSNVHDTSVVNIARLLQTLDSDGDPSNGIEIKDAAHTAATGMSDLNFASTTFDTAVANLVANSGSKNTALVDADSAIQHFTELALGVSGGIPSKFSMEWLSGRTLYIVRFGEWEDNDNPLDDAPSVAKLKFHADGTVLVSEGDFANTTGDTITYGVNNAGALYGDGTGINTIVCGSTPQYIKTHYMDTEHVHGHKNVDLFFFNEADALAYAATLTKRIEPCEAAAPPSSTTITIIDVDVEVVGQSNIVGAPIKTAYSCGDNCTVAADMFCTPEYDVGERETFVGRLTLDSLSGTATLGYVATTDQASGGYDFKTQSVLLTEVFPREEVTPAGSDVRYFSEGTLRVEATVDLATKVVTGMLYVTLATSWELDARKVECSSTATFTAKPKK